MTEQEPMEISDDELPLWNIIAPPPPEYIGSPKAPADDEGYYSDPGWYIDTDPEADSSNDEEEPEEDIPFWDAIDEAEWEAIEAYAAKYWCGRQVPSAKPQLTGNDKYIE